MLAPGARIGPFEVLAPLGAGGMGEVYRARDPRLGREVAIKVLPAERLAHEGRRRRFIQEARAASALNHPHIVTIYEVGESDGVDFIAMEYVPGQTLDGLIPKRGMPVRDVLRLAIPFADAVAAAHAKGIVHRDLKPANVVVKRDGAVKVLDFGLARLVIDDTSDAGETLATASASGLLSRPGAITGTAAYMSPEQATGGKVDARSDIFSFGAVLYEMVTGQRAFAGRTVSETLSAVVSDQPCAPSRVVSGIPDTLDRLIQRCLRKETAYRFHDMRDVKLELEQIAAESASGPSPAARAGGQRRLVAGVGITCLLAGAASSPFVLRLLRRTAAPAPTVVSLTSTPGQEGMGTLSPDGEQVAFESGGEKWENWDIYVTFIGSSEVHRLTTDPAHDHRPAWSPDGREVAFVRYTSAGAGAIHTVSPLGGRERKLGGLPRHHDWLAWSRNGHWLATGASPRSDVRGIRFVSVPGGEARVVTVPHPPAYHSFPAFSPDGAELAYASCPNPYACQIEVVKLGADATPQGPARRVTRKPMWLEELAWTRDGKSLVTCNRLDGWLWRVRLAGDEAPTRIDVAGSYTSSGPGTSGSRDRLVFGRARGSLDIYRYPVGGLPEVVVASSFRDSEPHFSPDGRRFAFASGRSGEGSEIWLAAADGSNPIQLTHGPGSWQGWPRWSPDGKRVAFDSRDEAGQWDIWTVEAEGGGLLRVTSGDADETQPSWSRDGHFVYFSSNRDGARNIWRAAANGGYEVQITRGGGSRPDEAADGSTVYYLGQEFGELDPDARGGVLRSVQVTGGPERPVIDCVFGWAFAVGKRGIYHLGCGPTPRSNPLVLLDPSSSRVRRLGELEGAGGSGITVSPDGRTVLYGRRGGEGSDLMMVENFRE